MPPPAADHSQHPPDCPVRLDKWLWAARFFKTRTLATEAINGGKVHINDRRVKPSRRLQCGDTLRIRKGPLEWTVTVTRLSNRRGNAVTARELYEENESSRQARETQRQQRRESTPQPTRRPDKKSRRQIHRFTRQHG